jgi:hypothetical protein
VIIQAPQRSKLIYPAGAQPGFDAAHPASQNVRLSAIPFRFGGASNTPQAMYINLLTGKPAISFLAQNDVKINSYIGPSANFVANNGQYIYFPAGTGKPNTVVAQTMAGIVFLYSVAASSGILATSKTTSTGQLLFIGPNTIGNYSWGDGADTHFSFPTSALTPYFFAISINNSIASGVLKNLATGQVFSGTKASTSTMKTTDGAFTIGLDQNLLNDPANGLISAVMASDVFLSEMQLLAWADDPWAFWFPPRQVQKFTGIFTAPVVTASALTRMLMGAGV